MKSSIKRYLVYLFFLTFCFFFSASYVSALNIRVGSKVLGNTQAKGASAPNRSSGATLNGADAYCVSPGKDMSSRISYTVDTEFFDLSNCQTAKGGVPSYACGVAIMMLKSYEKGYDYNTNLLALRIWSAFKSFDGDGEWHEEEKTPIYRLTAEGVINHGYNGTLNPAEVSTGVIYAINAKGLQELQDAIGLFRDAHSNNYNYFTVKTNSSQIVDIDKEGNVEFTIKTNFESAYTKNVKIVSLDSNVSLSIKSSGPCDDPTYKTCYVMTGKINGFNKKNCNTSRINYKITYQDSRDMLGAVSLIVPTNYTYYQRFVVFDSSAITTRQITGAVATTCPEIFQCKISTVVEEITDHCSQGTTWTKADPTIDCIINTDKLVADYDFSNKYVHDSSNSSAKVTNGNTTTTVNQTFYSVNTYCTIACRETVSYNLFDKETADSTKFFKYQNGVYNGNYLIATITGDRECATDIKYTAWKNSYKAADELVRTTWNTYKYYENLHVYTDPVSSVLSCSYTGGCSSSCGCHRCCDSCCDEKGCKSCNCSTCGCYSSCSSSCSWSGTKLTWPSKPYGFTNANGSISTPTSSGEDGYKSCGGSVCGGWSSCTGASGNANKYSSNYTTSKAAYENAVKKREELIGFIQDCNMYDKFSLNQHMTSGYTRNDKVSLYYEVTDGYDFNPEFSSFSYDSTYSNMIDLDYKTVLTNKTNATYCVGCDESKDFGATKTENLKYWVCTGAETGAKCTARDIVIPTNTRAFVTAQKQRYMWQDAEFYSTVPTGEMAATKKDNSIKISDYNVFPLEIGKLSGDYGVSTTVVNVGDADRKSVTKFSNESYSCEFTVPNKITIYDDTTTGGIGGYGFYYRTIDVDNVFPTGVKTGVWNTSTAKSLVKGIQEKGEEIYLETPAYEFILTPSNMRNIKSYNRQMDSTSSVFGGTLGYNDFNLTCNSNGDCVSNFLKSISRGGNLSDLVTSYKKDGVTQ